jgi:hypothetical protein
MYSYMVGRTPRKWLVAVVLLFISGLAHAAPKSSGILSVHPTAVNFGSVTIGGSQIQNVVMLNTGNGNVNIASASMSGPGFSVGGLTLPMTLAPGQSASFHVTYAPSSTGSASGAVYLYKNNGSTLATVSLSGFGLSPLASAQHAVTLNWVASPSTVMGYNVYRSSQAAGPFQRLNSTAVTTLQYNDTNVSSGQLYYYVVTAVDPNGAESIYSNESVASVP